MERQEVASWHEECQELQAFRVEPSGVISDVLPPGFWQLKPEKVIWPHTCEQKHQASLPKTRAQTTKAYQQQASPEVRVEEPLRSDLKLLVL